MDSSTLPKTLVVTSWAPPMVGGPQNLYNLLSQFPADQYSILTSAQAIRNQEKIGNWLPGEYIFYDGSDPRQSSAASGGSAKKNWKSLLMAGIRHIPFIGGYSADILTVVYSVVAFIRAGRRAARTHEFAALMGISDTGAALIATWLTAKIIHRPYVVYLFDIYLGNNLRPIYRWLARLFEKRIFQNATAVIVTNDGTADYYRRRYGQSIKTSVIYNSVFAEDYERQRTPYQPKAPYTILFTGHIYWAQEQAVMNLVKAMDQLSDLPVQLQLYVPRPSAAVRRAVEGKERILLAAAEQSEMPRIQSQATLLFLPLAWNTRSPDIIATATPGKFTDYLASGRPMLVHAPAYAYISQYARAHILGVVVDQDNVDALAHAIRDFLKNPEQGRQYVENALRVFGENHDARKNAEKLTKLLKTI